LVPSISNRGIDLFEKESGGTKRAPEDLGISTVRLRRAIQPPGIIRTRRCREWSGWVSP
jgi:hypothetical protein